MPGHPALRFVEALPCIALRKLVSGYRPHRPYGSG
jgi:hypothetical protein